MATPLLSICIPSFNRADWLKACLEACLPQARALPEGLVEVVVSENASEDSTPQLLAEYAALYPGILKVNRNPENNGILNFVTVVRCATGKYVWLMGDDDAPLPGALALVTGLIQAEPRDFYLPHVVADSVDPAVRRLEWFDDLPRVDWDLSDRGELLEYMAHGRNASAVFSFISVLIFLREPWLEASARCAEAFNGLGWPQVATAFEYLKEHGRLRVIPEALVNYHCSTGAWGETAWWRAMLDLRGLVRVAETYFPHDPALFDAYLGNLRKNHGDGWIAHHRLSAPDEASWEESRTLLLRAGFDPLKVAAVALGERMLTLKAATHRSLDPGGLVLADLACITRGARRVLILAGAAGAGVLEALRKNTRAEILVMGTEAVPAPGLPEGPALAYREVDLSRFSADLAYQEATGAALQAFAPDLLLNLDPLRHPGWDLLAEAAGALAAVAFQAPERAVEARVAAWLDSHYTRVLPPSGPSMVAALGLGAPGLRDVAPPAIAIPVEAPRPPQAGPLKLNLGCGQDHLPGWVNVDQFPGSHPDVVHDLESFPWPFPDGCAEEILLKHVLEHLGRTSDTFLKIIQELYRVCAPGARVRILVPHPRHQDFLQDPTHVRPVLPEMFQHFSLATNKEWIRLGLPGTPLALYLGLDFELQSSTLHLDPRWEAEFRSGNVSREQLDRAILDRNNVVQATEILLKAVKPFGGAVPQPSLAVRWEGSQFVYHSLAHVNRQLCLKLLASGKVDLSLVPYEPDQFLGEAFPAFRPLAPCVNRILPAAPAVHVRHQWPPSFDPPAQGAWVMIQPWEFGGIPAEWVGPMRDQVDEVWVPSPWVKDCYVKSGIPEDQVVVVPNGVDPEVFRPEGERFPLNTRKTCKFLFLGGTIHRKGIDLLLEAYQKTFRITDDVCLVIKGQAGGVYGAGDLADTLAQLRALDPLAPEIEYRVDNLEESRIAELYRACDVLVLPYRGEGFGLPIAEAMASGLPVIVTGRGGSQGFVKEDWAYLIPSVPRSVGAVDAFHPSQAGFWLEEPDGEALGNLLLRACTRGEERREKGRRARAFALAGLGWDRAAAVALARLEALAPLTPRRLRPPVAAQAQAPEAFLYEPEWARAEWVEVLLSYLQAFKPGEPVALVLAWDGEAGLALEAAQDRVLDLVRRSKLESFPDVVLVEKPEELGQILEAYAVVRKVPRGRGAVEGLEGAFGARLGRARAQLCGA